MRLKQACPNPNVSTLYFVFTNILCNSAVKGQKALTPKCDSLKFGTYGLTRKRGILFRRWITPIFSLYRDLNRQFALYPCFFDSIIRQNALQPCLHIRKHQLPDGKDIMHSAWEYEKSMRVDSLYHVVDTLCHEMIAIHIDVMVLGCNTACLYNTS